jgi:fumarate hydratase class II
MTSLWELEKFDHAAMGSAHGTGLNEFEMYHVVICQTVAQLTGSPLSLHNPGSWLGEIRFFHEENIY